MLHDAGKTVVEGQALGAASEVALDACGTFLISLLELFPIVKGDAGHPLRLYNSARLRALVVVGMFMGEGDLLDPLE